MRSKAINCQLAGDEDLSGDGALSVPSALALEVLDYLHRVLPSPTAHCEECFRPVPLSQRFGIGNRLAAASVRSRIGHSPLDLARVEWILKRRLKLTGLLIGILLQTRRVLQYGSGRHCIGGPCDSCVRLHFISFPCLPKSAEPQNRTRS